MGISTHEYWEEQKREAEADIERVVGIVLAIVGIGGIIYSPISLILTIIGAIAFWDGSVKIERIKHIVWTKQALREYGVEKNSENTNINPGSSYDTTIKPKVTIIPEQDEINIKNISEIQGLLDELDKRFINGSISESNYNELKNKYIKKLNEAK